MTGRLWSKMRWFALAVTALTLLAGCTGSSGRHPSSAAPPYPAAIPPVSNESGSTAAVPIVLLSKLEGANVPTTFILRDDTKRVTEAKFFLTTHSTKFISSTRAAPFETAIVVPAGPNSIQVRHEVDGERISLVVHFMAKAGANTRVTSPPLAPTGATRVPPIAVPRPTVRVSTPAQLSAALSSAAPGDVIHLADGEYVNDKGKRWLLSRSGTASAPITLDGGRGAVVESDSPTGDYGLSITGSYWHVLGITVRDASKGIVLDNSQHTLIDNVQVYDVGDEGVHFRSCSSNSVLQNSYVHDTGMDKPSFGEGVYVGSANSNWPKYGCSAGQDKSEHDTIRGNTFRHIAAEGADLKEGTDSGTLAGNAFIDTGYSGENSADSAVDAKGNNWLVTANVVSDPSGADTDAFQTHSVYPGYGTANVFTANVVQGHWPGFGIGMYPQQANVVYCSNMALDAAKGVVGADGHKIRCAP